MCPTKLKQNHLQSENAMKTRNDGDELSMSVSTYDKEEGNCGYGSCEPTWLQVFNNPKGFLVLHCCVLVVQGILVTGLFTVVISSLEKRFGFQSSETGTVSICFDIGFCVVTPFVSYYGTKLHRPRFIGIGMMLLALGSLLFSIPHFTTPAYQYSDELNSIDGTSNDGEADCKATNNEPSDLRNYFWMFIFGQLLSGAGSACLYNLGLSFIEDTVPKDSGSIYLGIANAATGVGPIIGYLIGGYLLTIYVDFDTVDSSQVEITPADPRWVGAWWFGFLICAICSFAISFPRFGFPKQIPGTARNRAMKESEVPVDGGEEIAREKDFGKSIKDLPAATLILIKNSSFVFIALSTVIDNLSENGFATFLPKIIEKEFQQTASYASFVTGTIVFPAAILGGIMGAIIVNRFKWNIPGICKFCLVTFFFSSGLRASILLGCENRSVAGVTTAYTGNDMYNGSLWASCNSDCNCQQEYYIPTCGADDVNYFSPCHAGCTGSQVINETTYFFNCSCINVTNVYGWMAKEGNCPSDCNSLNSYLVSLFFSTFVLYLSSTPTIVIMFRLVPPNLRTFSLGVRTLLARAVGAIPGPILYGAIFDLTCILWQTGHCDKSQGVCWIYDNWKFALYMFIIPASGKAVSIVLYFCALWFYKSPPQRDQEIKEETSHVYETSSSSKNNDNSLTSSDQRLNNESTLDVATSSTKLNCSAVITRL